MESEKIIFTLNPTIIQNFPFERYEQNFTFIVDGKRYSTSRIVADLLSPIIREFHYQDESNQEFYINKYKSRTNDERNDNDDSFSNFLQLLRFAPTELDSKTRELYSLYFYELGNIDSFLELEMYDTTELTLEKSISILQKIENMQSNYKCIFKEEYKEKIINNISSHFEELDKEEIKKMKLKTLEEIICSPELKINDEDSLLDFLICKYEEDRSSSFLFEYIQFCNVSEQHLKNFVDKIFIEDINQKTFYHFCELIFSKDKIQNSKENERYIKNDSCCTIQKEQGKELEGILNFLTKQTGGNIHDNGTIEITPNSINGNDHPKNLVDYQSNSYYYPAGNDRDAFVCFDFKDKLIQLTSYSIKSYDSVRNAKHLRNWIIEVSNDGKTWQEIDRHENEEQLNGPKIIVNFEISPPTKEFYRFVRLLETGINWDSRNDRYDGGFQKLNFLENFSKLKHHHHNKNENNIE